MRKLDGGATDPGIAVISRASRHEPRMQLQLAEGQLTQPLEGREARAEVGDPKCYVVNAQLRGNLVGQINVLDDLMLADLQDQARPPVTHRPVASGNYG